MADNNKCPDTFEWWDIIYRLEDLYKLIPRFVNDEGEFIEEEIVEHQREILRLLFLDEEDVEVVEDEVEQRITVIGWLREQAYRYRKDKKKTK